MINDLLTSVDKVADVLMNQWGKRSLSALYFQACSEVTGCRFDAIKPEGGKRLMIVACFTEKTQIATLRRLLAFGDPGPGEDWYTLTLLDLVMRVAPNGGLGFEVQKTETGDWNALALIAADPDSVSKLEVALGLNP